MLANKLSHNIKTISFFVTILILAIVPIIVKSPYYLDLIIVTIVYAVMAMTFIILLKTGLVSLGLAVFWGLGAYTSAILVMKLGLSFWIGLPAGAIVAGLFAFVLSPFLLKSGGITFLLLNAVLGLLFIVIIGNSTFLGMYTGINNIPEVDPIKLPFLPVIEFVSKIPYYYLGLILLIVIVLVVSAFNATKIGKAWTAIGLKPRLAESIGINVYRYRMYAFVLASAIAGLIGAFWAHYEGFIQPNGFNMWMTNYFQLYAILGGIGHGIAGPLLGAAIMKFFPEMIRFTQQLGNIITGVLLILLILFLPRGILSLFDKKRKFGEGFIFIRNWAKSSFTINRKEVKK